MTQLELLKELLGNPDSSDAILQFCLDCASDVICDIRNSDKVESKYLKIQIKIAIEIFSKMGAEGQTGHSENSISRSYETGDISPSLISQIVPFGKTPYSTIRVVV